MNSDTKLDAQRQRLSSVVTADLLPSLEGVELGAYGKVNVSVTHSNTCKARNAAITDRLLRPQTVSYAQFLYPTNALVKQKSSSATENCTAQTPQSRFRGNGQRNFTPARPNNSVAQEPCKSELTDAHLLPHR